MITLVTGVFGTGKTTAAKAFSREFNARYVPFDTTGRYDDISPRTCQATLRDLEASDDVVTDAIPFDPTWNTFRTWAQRRDDVHILWNVCSRDEWIARNHARRPKNKNFPEVCDDAEWKHFHLVRMPTLRMPFTAIYDGRVVSREDALNIAGYKQLLLDRIRNPEQHYDAGYQDIPELGFHGYSTSKESWDGISGLADWSAADVVDLGCFHGYMLFRAEDAQAGSVVGLERSAPARITAAAVGFLRRGKAEFREWSAGEPIPKADVTLCLNALHHFGEQRFDVYQQIRSPVTIFEVDAGFEPELREHWPTVTRHTSTRPKRAIFRCER